MPRIDPTELEALDLAAPQLVRQFILHDVWLVHLQGATQPTISELRSRLNSVRARRLPLVVRILFSVRSILGRLFRLDSGPADTSPRVLADLPKRLADASLTPPGTPEGPFVTLYVLPHEAAYEIVNATVHAVLVVALAPADSGTRLFWATYLRPVGRITGFYMRLIDPFRRTLVYPGLERWLKNIVVDHDSGKGRRHC